jgi:hypothetical protein
VKQLRVVFKAVPPLGRGKGTIEVNRGGVEEPLLDLRGVLPQGTYLNWLNLYQFGYSVNYSKPFAFDMAGPEVWKSHPAVGERKLHCYYIRREPLESFAKAVSRDNPVGPKGDDTISDGVKYGRKAQ